MPNRFGRRSRLIHAIVAMHGEQGRGRIDPVSMRLARQSLASLRSKVPRLGRSSAIVPLRHVVGWLGTTGILAALRRRAIEGGSYRVVVSLTRTVLWLLSLVFSTRPTRKRRRVRTRSTRTALRICLPRNTAWHLSGNDRPNRIVAHTRRLPNVAGSARLKQTEWLGK